MGYLLENCLFDRLSSEIIDQCQPYTCSKDADIDSFFHQDKEDNYSDYLSEMMAYTHCFYTDEKDKVDENGKKVKSKMVCAFSLSTSALRADALPNRKRNKLNKVIPNDKRRPQYPAILIGQLCVFDGFGLHSFPYNVGDEMMDLIKTMAINPDNDFAVRYLVVDALNIPNVTDYFLRNGFKNSCSNPMRKNYIAYGDIQKIQFGRESRIFVTVTQMMNRSAKRVSCTSTLSF